MSEITRIHVVDFALRRSATEPRPKTARLRKREPKPGECAHAGGFEVDVKHRTVECATCHRCLDPITVLLMLTEADEKVEWRWLHTARAEADSARREWRRYYKTKRTRPGPSPAVQTVAIDKHLSGVLTHTHEGWPRRWTLPLETMAVSAMPGRGDGEWLYLLLHSPAGWGPPIQAIS